MVVSKRVARRAVDRNRVKRLIREQFRFQRGLDGFDLLVRLRSVILGSEMAAAAAELKSLFEGMRS